MRSLALAATLAVCLTSAGAVAAPSDAGRIEFEVLRNGQPFGRHAISVTGTDDNLRAQTEIALRAGVGPVTVFRLEQRCSETWSDGVLSGLSCSTLKDGRRTLVRAQTREGRLHVTGAEGEHWFPLGVFPSTWWTKPPASTSTLIDTETGAPIRVRVTPMGREMIEIGGRQIDAERIRVQGTLTVDLWYDAAGRWVGCSFTARGQNIEYRLASPHSAAPA